MARTLVYGGFALVLLGTLAVEAAAQSSCSAENALCVSRGGGARCAEKMTNCKRNGCWEHLAKYGGRICSLKKS
jgi:hypothetical protein